MSRRHLALPIDRYLELDGFGAANDAFIEAAVELGAQAVLGALDAGGAASRPRSTTSSRPRSPASPCPRIEARIADRDRAAPRRAPGAAVRARLRRRRGRARPAARPARGDPTAVGVLLSVELCSLTVQRDDPSMANLVASGLFGDGAAAVVAVGDERPGSGPTIVDSRAHLYPDTERAMGWDIGGTGLKIVLGAEVPDLVTEYLGDDVRQFLRRTTSTSPT